MRPDGTASAAIGFPDTDPDGRKLKAFLYSNSMPTPEAKATHPAIRIIYPLIQTINADEGSSHRHHLPAHAPFTERHKLIRDEGNGPFPTLYGLWMGYFIPAYQHILCSAAKQPVTTQ